MCTSKYCISQIPTLFSHTRLTLFFYNHRSQGTMGNFQQMLDNIFQPLFEVTNDPASHPALHHFLQLVGAYSKGLIAKVFAIQIAIENVIPFKPL